ncbi:MAG: HmuY family protein [Bacteroidia bacterium]|nr:HmuY family protein [Paludibacteraceae bacterium]MBP9081854.1 HmuY family protein [Bacteroidia bacterium]
MRQLLVYISLLIFFASCEKEDEKVVLPPPGEITTMTAAMGNNYDNQVYVDFETGQQVSVPYRSYDLAFEASETGFRVYLNTGKLMFIVNTGSTDILNADTTGLTWMTDPDHLYDDSTAFGTWMDFSGNSLNQVFVIDRGRTEHFGANRWRKMQLLSVNATEYRIKFAAFNTPNVTEFVLPKNSDYSLMYFSFENNGQLVQVAPPKNLWDVVFTKFTHTYYSEPVNSPYRYYIVTGALLNRWAGCENTIMQQDSTPGFKSFETITGQDMGNFPFYKEAAIIGFDWKLYDFNLGYIIYNDRYYGLKDPSGFYFKIRFLDFYDSLGNKGACLFEYQRL